MDVTRAYKLSLLLPIIVPILFAPALFFISFLTEGLAVVLMAIVYSIVYGGIPYLILVGLLLWWMRGKNEPQIKQALLLSPLFMLIVFQAFAGVWIALFSEAKPKIGQFAGSLVLLSPFVLIFGYAYVGIAFGMIEVWKKRKA